MINKNKFVFGFIFPIFIIFFFVQEGNATVLISDRFDDGADWDGSVDPPAPWGSYGFFGAGSTVINSTAAYGGSGKGFKINWPSSQKEFALSTPNDISSYGSEIYIGFRYRHSTPFDWGTSSGTHKWLHMGTGDGESFIFNYNRGGLEVFWNGIFHFRSNIPWDNNDGNWHTFVFRLKHNTGSNSDGVIQVWRDGTEVVFTKNSNGLYNSINQVYIGSSTNDRWGGAIKFGFQFHNGIGSGQWENWDDVIIATTQLEVTDFLGEPSAGTPGIQQVIIDGPDLVNENNTASYTATAVFTDNSTQNISEEVIWTVDSNAATMNDFILSTSSVTGDQTASISASYSFNGVTTVTPKLITIKEAGVTVFINEPFDDALLDQRGWYDSGALNQVVEFDGERQENVLRIDYPVGSTIPPAGAMRHLFPESESIHIKYFVKYSSGWAWSGLNFGPHEFYVLTNADHQWKGPAYSNLTFYIEMLNGVPRLAIQDSENIDTSAVNTDLTGVTENRAVAGCNGSLDTFLTTCYSSGGLWFNGKFWDASISPINTGKWYAVDVYARMNSIVDGLGVPDGIVEYFLDGKLIVSLRDILFRTGAQADLKFNQFMIGPYFEDPVPAAQSFWIDNLQVDSGDTLSPENPELTLSP